MKKVFTLREGIFKSLLDDGETFRSIRTSFNIRPDSLAWSRLILFAFVLYIIYLAYLVFWSNYYGRNIVHHSYNLYPFHTIREFIHSNLFGRAVVINILGNIAAFLPMGFLLTAVFKKLDTLKKVAFVTIVVSLFIEISQYATGTGTGDIDDVILNLIGGVIGYGCYQLIAPRIRYAHYTENSHD